MNTKQLLLKEEWQIGKWKSRGPVWEVAESQGVCPLDLAPWRSLVTLARAVLKTE